MAKKKPAPKKTTMMLNHEFSEDEIREMTENLTDQMIDVVKLEIEKKEATADFKRKLDQLKKQNNQLAMWLNKGEKEQEVAVEIYHNWPVTGRKTIIRMDTFEDWTEDMGPWDNTLDNNLPGEQDEDVDFEEANILSLPTGEEE